MQRHTLVLISSLFGLTGVFLATGVIANPIKPMHGMHGAHMMQGGMAGHGMYGQHGSRLLSPHWKQTLTTDQRLRIDQMHLEFTKVKMTLKARIKALKIELALLSTADMPSSEAMENKIEEVLAVKRNMMRIRFGHIASMRQALNPEQRISFDLDVLKKIKRSKSKHH